jgi:hypothetical protein
MHDYPGPAYAGKAYAIGTPEIFIPKTDGFITPISNLKGGDNFHFAIDARGADAGVDQKIKAAVVEAVQIARKMSMHDQIEYKRRT